MKRTLILLAALCIAGCGGRRYCRWDDDIYNIRTGIMVPGYFDVGAGDLADRIAAFSNLVTAVAPPGGHDAPGRGGPPYGKAWGYWRNHGFPNIIKDKGNTPWN